MRLSAFAGEAGRMLRDAFTDPARRNERRPSLLSHRGERQGLGFFLRHFDRQRYATQHGCHRHFGNIYWPRPLPMPFFCLPAPFSSFHPSVTLCTSITSSTSTIAANNNNNNNDNSIKCLTLPLFFFFLFFFSCLSALSDDVHSTEYVKVEPVSMATVIAVVIACLFLIIVVTLCLLYAYRSERCCFNRESPF